MFGRFPHQNRKADVARSTKQKKKNTDLANVAAALGLPDPFQSGGVEPASEMTSKGTDATAGENDADLSLARQTLRDIMRDPLASAAAKASAARTLAEMAGALGRHAKPPADSDRPLHEMTRAELEQALRAADCGA